MPQPKYPKAKACCQSAQLLSCGLPVLGSADDERYGGSLATTAILELSWGGQISQLLGICRSLSLRYVEMPGSPQQT